MLALVVLWGALTVGPISGGAFNPAVGIILPLLNGESSDMWVYILGPLIGSALALTCYRFTNHEEFVGRGKYQLKEEEKKDHEVQGGDMI